MAKRCMSPSCYSIVRDGTARCETHTITQKKVATQLRYGNNNENKKLYNSARWRRISKKLRQIRPFCAHCMEHGVEVIGNVVDHIIELSDGGDKFNMDNLQVLCHQCHNTKTADERRKRGD